MATKRKNRAGLKKARRNPRKVAGKSTTLKNMASVTIRKLPNGVVKITGRKMAANPGKAKRAKRSSDAHLFRQAGDKRYKRPTSMARWHSGRASSERRGQYRKAPIYRNGLVGTYRVADKPGGRSTFYPNMRTALKAAQRLANRTGVAEEIRRVTSQYGDDEFDRKVWPQDLRKR